MQKHEILFRGVYPGGSVFAQSVVNGSLCRTSMSDRRLGPYLHEVKEGGFIIDKWRCGATNGIASIIIKQPMLDVTLNTDQIDYFIDENHPSSFDSCGLNVYMKIVREMKDVRIGQRIKNNVHWEDGVVEPIDEVINWMKTYPCDEILKEDG